mgnify:CR=1 FL=1
MTEITRTSAENQPLGVSDSIIDLIRGNRPIVGGVLVSLAAVFLVLFAYWTNRGGLWKLPTVTTSEKKTDSDTKADSGKDSSGQADSATADKSEVANLRKGEYIVGGVTAFAAAVILLSLAWYLLLRTPSQDDAAQRIAIRMWLLIGGSLLGLLLIIAGIIFLYIWSESVTRWLDQRNFREARWVLLPLLMILCGVLLMFLSIIPARSEERHDALIRRLVYGSNFGLTTLLLLVVLIVVNVVIAREIPNQLDTTATGFYTLSEPTRQLLERLDPPIRAYALIPNVPDRDINDIRQLLLAMQDASNGRFVVRFLSQSADRTELATLREKYPQFEMVMDQRTTQAVILLTTATDEKRHAVVSDNDMFDFSRRNFEGEKKLYQEIAFLADSQNKPVVYFTQGHGEMDATNNPDAPPERSVNRLRQYLEKNYLDVRTVHLNQANPKIPNDARIVIIAEPQDPYSSDALNALREYMNRKDNKGKLIYFSGTVTGPDGQVLRTGIEDLLAEFNVRVGREYLYTMPTGPGMDYRVALVGFSASAVKNPILQSIARITSRLQFIYPREVSPQNTRSEFQASDLLLSVGITWLETVRPPDMAARLEEILTSERVQEQVRLSRSPRPVAVTVTEGATPRLVAFGTGLVFSDRVAQQIRGSNPVTFDLLGVSVDWLRERQTSLAAVNIEAKKYTEYRIPSPSNLNFTRLMWLPLGLGLLSVIGMGAGVWVVRRR